MNGKTCEGCAGTGGPNKRCAGCGGTGKARAKAGRPEYQPTKAIRRKVAIAAGGGMSHERIAVALGIARSTLEIHFAEELTTGACEKELAVKAAIFAQAVKGNVAAAREYLKGAPYVVPPAPDQPQPADPAAAGGPAKVGPEGLKGARDRIAQTAQVGSEWEDVLRRPKSLQ